VTVQEQETAETTGAQLSEEQAESPRHPISITAVVDVVGALATRGLSGNLYLLDTNKTGGSTGIGTEELKTKVKKGDQLLWTVLPLECEAYASIDDIMIDSAVCEVEQRTYPGTDISYWAGTVKKDIDAIPYQISFKLGTRIEPITTASSALSPFLIGEGTESGEGTGQA
jgi:hypothetical protein